MTICFGDIAIFVNEKSKNHFNINLRDWEKQSV